MPIENGTLSSEAEISQIADAFVKLLDMESLGVARVWVGRIAGFSESPIVVEPADDRVVRLNLKVYGRDLYLDFRGPKEIAIHYFDGNLEQACSIKNRDWNIGDGSTASCINIRLEDGARVDISKEPELKIVRIYSFPAA